MSLLIHEPSTCQDSKQETRIEIRHERRSDTSARERLLDAAFGASGFAKTSEPLREGRVPARGPAFIACVSGRLVGTLRPWSSSAGPAIPACCLVRSPSPPTSAIVTRRGLLGTGRCCWSAMPPITTALASRRRHRRTPHARRS